MINPPIGLKMNSKHTIISNTTEQLYGGHTSEELLSEGLADVDDFLPDGHNTEYDLEEPGENALVEERTLSLEECEEL